MVGLGRIFGDGVGLLRERLAIYGALALLCALVEWYAFARVDLVAALIAARDGKPAGLVFGPPIGVVLGLSLLAQFAIVPSAVTRIDPSFRLTMLGIAMMLATVVVIGAMTDLGYVLAVLPGIAVAVLFSQALIGALVRTRPGMRPRDVPRVLGAAMRASVAMTREHFATTLGVVVLSLLILVPPFSFAAFWVIVFGAKSPPSLVVTAPALFLLFVYLECVRYSLIVRWYRRLLLDERGATPVPGVAREA